MKSKSDSGYLYVLVHPCFPKYYKLGQTTKHPTERLKNHNNDETRILGKLASITKKPWQLLYYVPVTNARKAESATLWYDVMPRWDNLELNNGEIGPVIEDIINSPYIDQMRYNDLLQTELLKYDYKIILESIEKDWCREGLAEESEEIIEKVKAEIRKNDRRHK